MNIIHRSRLLWTATACVFTLATGGTALADDTEIFFGQNAATGPESQPNILLILDSSGSMKNAVPDDPFGRDRLAVVQDVANDFIDTMEGVNVGLMKYDIRAYSGDSYSDGGMVIHAVSDIATSRNSLSNEVNKIVHVGTTPLQETYFEAARYMIGESVFYGLNSYEGKWSNSGGYYYKSKRKSVGASRVGGSGGSMYKSPMIGACQRNYIVYLTDGAPVRDKNGTSVITSLLNDPDYTAHDARSCENPDGLTDGGECLDELAEFLFDNDFNANMPGKQNVISNFIGFAIDLPFLERAAELGGGGYYRAADAETLRVALQEIFNNVSEDVNGFTAPAVTVNAFDRTTHLDQLFFTVFQPDDRYNWPGNVKKYRFEPRADEDGLLIVDKNGNMAVNPETGFFYDGRDLTGAPDPSVPTSWSFWSDEADGASVTKGGAAGELTLDRNVLTNSGGSTLTAVNRSNSSMRSALSGLPVPWYGGQAPSPSTANDAVVDRWLDWASGIDVYDSDEDGNDDDARQYMGDPLHSKPSVVVYGGTSESPKLVLFVGTNEGVMHAIDGATGEESFAFMPKELWGNIPYLAENPKLGPNDRKYGVDGPITVWKDDGGDGQIDPASSDFVYLYFGLRRGGNGIYALDVTDPENPQFMWDFSDSDYGKMGQSWSQPIRATVNFGTNDSPNEKEVLIVGGGYDPAQDSKSSYSDDSEGNAVVMLDARTGALLWSASNSAADLQLADMKSAIPAGVRALDLNLDGSVDRMYTIDIAGRMWRFDVHNEESFEITGGVIAELGGTDMGGAANNRRYYYAPDVALGTQEGRAFITITAASGFRAHPLESTIQDYLLGVRDYKPFELLGEDSDDYDYGIGIPDLETIAISGSGTTLSEGAAGWKLPLGGAEKALARSRIFQNKAYFTTYEPGSPPSSNPCAPAVGTGALYTVDLKTGAVDRNVLKKPGIPPEPTFIFGPPDDEPIEIDNCYGPYCDTYTPPDETECEEGEQCEDEYEETEPGGRQVECLAGPESCIADGNEFPVRTYWRQLDQSE